MISVIICSADLELLNKIRRNIHRTIGVPYEILGYDNSIARKGICEIYNQGVRDAAYSILCFVHEDVELKTMDWGKEVLNIFAGNPHLGLLGVAGSSYKSLSPSGWHGAWHSDLFDYINILQKYKYTTKAEKLVYNNRSTTSVSKVAVIDGVWFCGKKEIFARHPFDQNLLRKFHGYDIDISLALGQYYDVMVTVDILMAHDSEGTFGAEWVKETLLVQEKWKYILPVNKAGMTAKEMKKCEKSAFKTFINKMRQSGYSAYTCIRVLNRSGILKRFGWQLYMRLYIKCLSTDLRRVSYNSDLINQMRIQALIAPYFILA